MPPPRAQRVSAGLLSSAVGAKPAAWRMVLTAAGCGRRPWHPVLVTFEFLRFTLEVFVERQPLPPHREPPLHLFGDATHKSRNLPRPWTGAVVKIPGGLDVDVVSPCCSVVTPRFARLISPCVRVRMRSILVYRQLWCKCCCAPTAGPGRHDKVCTCSNPS